MQFLVFHLGRDRYGLSTRHVIRVLPLLELKQLPGAPNHVAGLMNFRGESVPVIDLCMLAHGKACQPHFDTRILLIDYCAGKDRHMLGVVVERVTGMENLDADAFSEPGVSTEHAPFLGKVRAEGGGILQLINIEHLLTEDVRAILFPRHQQELT